jgi:hypothetical protein
MRSVLMHLKFKDFTGFDSTDKVNLLKQSISFERCAYIVSNAFLNGLIKSGLTPTQAMNVYTSKAFRHKLDWDLEDALERVAFKAGKNVGEGFYAQQKPEDWINDKLRKEIKKELDNRMEPEFA